MSKNSKFVLNQRKSNPNDDEDENHNNTPRSGTPRIDQDPELSSDTPEEDMNSEQAVKALGECLGLIQPQTNKISTPQGATRCRMSPPQFMEQARNHSVVDDSEGYDHTFGPNHTFGPYAANQNFNCNPNQTFGPQVQNPNQTFGPQSQNLGHNPNRTFCPPVQNPNQTFGPQSQNLGHNPNRTFDPQVQNPNQTFGPQSQNLGHNPNRTFGPQVQNPNQTFGPQSQNLVHNPNRTFGPQALNPNLTFGPQSQNLGYNPNRTFGPQVQNPNQTFGPQSQNLGHYPNQTFGPFASNQNVSQNPNQTFGPHGQSHVYEYKHGDQHGDSCSSCPPSDTSSNIIWEEPVDCPVACTTVEKDDLIENLISLYYANKDVPDRLRVLKIIEGAMLKNEALAKFLIREDFCQALDEDIGKLVKICLNSDKPDPETEECLIYDRKLQARIKKAALGQNNEDMVRKIFRKNERNLSLLARV